jgi:hypothetical protein
LRGLAAAEVVHNNVPSINTVPAVLAAAVTTREESRYQLT